MKKRESFPIIGFFVCFLLSLSCTGEFRDINTDPSGITGEDMKIDYNHLGIPLGIIQQGIYFNYDFGKGKNWPYQLMQNLNADMFSGYMHDYKPHNGGSSNSDYNLQEGWNGTDWLYTYAYILPRVKKLEDSTRVAYPSVYAITKILKVEIMHRISDIYGPIIYTQFDSPEGDYSPETQQEAYAAFFDDLDDAVRILSLYIESEKAKVDVSEFDILLDGRLDTWVKFANSLRMRLAIRIAMADPVQAKNEFLKAFHQKYGVWEEPAERVSVSTRNGYLNPLGEINRVWGEVFMNASMESILNG